MAEIAQQSTDKTLGQLLKEASWYILYTCISIGTLFALGALITLTHPASFPMALAALLAFAAPWMVGFVIGKIRHDEIAPQVWLAGLVWFSIVSVWVLDMPTGPGMCEHCGAFDKLYRTFFTLNVDSGLIDGNGRLVGTWPALAMVGYALGANLAGKKKRAAED